MGTKALLFITCLGDQFYPDVLRDMVRVLERLGVECDFPQDQTCCGQPFYNSGLQIPARDLAIKWMRAFSRSDGFIVSPSASCVDFVRHRYPELFPVGTPEHALAKELAERTFEFSQFLVNVLRVVDVGARFPYRVTYHASCHGLRGLGLAQEPKQLLQAVRDLEFVPLEGEETCCGFGGIFSVVYPEISRAMMRDKVRNIQASGAQVVVSCENGCLMNIGGGLQRANSSVRALHLIRVLASREMEP